MSLFQKVLFSYWQPRQSKSGEVNWQQQFGSSYTTKYFSIIPQWNIVGSCVNMTSGFPSARKAGGSLNRCSFYLKQSLQLGAKTILSGKALKNHKRSPAAHKNFSLLGSLQSRIVIFCMFWVICSSWTLHLVLSNDCTINNSFLLVILDIYSLGPSWLFFFVQYSHISHPSS